LRGASGNGAADFPEFEAPDIALSSAANVHVAAKDCVNVASEEHTAFTAGGHFSIAAGKSLFASVREKFAFYAQKTVTLVTPGPIRIESINRSMAHSSLGDLSLTSTRGIVQIAGRNGVDIACGGTLLRIRPEGITGFTDGNFLVHAASHATDKPQPKPVDYPVTADKPGKLAAHHVLVEKHDGFAIQNQPYRLTLDDGQIIEGVTNEFGEMALVTSNATTFGLIELMSQSESGNVVGLVSTTIYRDANLPPSPPDAATMRRSIRVGGTTASTPETGATSQGKEPVFLSCDPMNFGLRTYRYIGSAKPDQTLGLARKDVEYSVAKAYTAAVKKTLGALDWKALKSKPTEEIGNAISLAVKQPLYDALGAGVFGLPSNSMPGIVVITRTNASGYGFALDGRDAAVFGANGWNMGIAEPPFDLLFNALGKIDSAPDEIKKKTALAGFDARLKDLATTIYHESRHCQQTFWMMSLYSTYKKDYDLFPGIDIVFNSTVLERVRKIAYDTPFPDDSLVRIGLHRMLIFYYWWFIVVNRETGRGYKPWEKIFADANKVQDEVAKMRGISLQQANQMAQRTAPGYYTHYHEEDAYATEDAVTQYWDHPDRADLVNPGTCTKHYREALEQIGVSGNG
jgi:type VI secretion system secreted protein VgrG